MNDKRQTQEQWTTDPCGAETAGDLVPGTASFFARIDVERYQVYAPWLGAFLDTTRLAGQRVLEIGPGLGTDHARLARQDAILFAADLTARHLELTRSRFQLEGLTTRPTQADAEALPFRDGVFDAVYTFGVIHHTPDMPGAVDEIHRVLRPGGLAMVALYHRDSAFYWIRTILLNGLLRAGLLRKGYRRLMSEIEYRSEGSRAVPLVQVLSRAHCRKLFAAFGEVTIRTAHLDFSHFVPAVPPAPWHYRRRLEQVGRSLGWYLLVSARKTAGRGR